MQRLGPILPLPTGTTCAAERPNVVLTFTNNLGYGDLGCYGSPTIHRPQLQ